MSDVGDSVFGVHVLADGAGTLLDLGCPGRERNCSGARDEIYKLRICDTEQHKGCTRVGEYIDGGNRK